MSELVKKANKATLPARSFFQLKHFVVGQHDTPEMQYRQILIEIKDLVYKIKNAELELEKTKHKIRKLQQSTDEIDHIKAQQKELGAIVTLDALEGAKCELNYLLEIAKDYRHYELADIERNQPLYWKKRLMRQAETERQANIEGVGAGNLASIIQAGLTEKEITV